MGRGRVVAAVLAVLAGLGTVPVAPAAAAVLPPGFSDSLVVAVPGPTALAFTPDRRMLVTTQGGTLRVVQNGSLVAAPARDLSARICSQSERGQGDGGIVPGEAQDEADSHRGPLPSRSHPLTPTREPGG